MSSSNSIRLYYKEELSLSWMDGNPAQIDLCSSNELFFQCIRDGGGTGDEKKAMAEGIWS